jgi:glycosyltransferase involved in cell wall biosynthesis
MKKHNRETHVLLMLENHIYPNDVRVKPHAECLSEHGYNVTVISPGGKGFAKHEIIEGVNVYRYPTLFAGKTKKSYMGEYLVAVFFLTLLPLWVWIKHGLDIVVFYNPPDIFWVCGLIPKLFGKKLIFDIRDLAPELFVSKFGNKATLLQRILTSMEFWSCQIADHIVVTNETSRKIIRDRNRLSMDRVGTIRQGPDTEKIAPTMPEPTLRARAGIIIGYLGNMAPERGIGNLLQALHYLKYDLGYSDWYCVLVGRQTEALSLEKLAADLGIEDEICLTGFLPQKNWVRIMSTVDICVDPGASNPGNDVSTTNKMMDYMALGKPVVAFHLPERYNTAEDTALYVHSNDNFDLARQIALLIDSPELRQKLGNAGRERAVNYLGWQHQKKLLIALFERLTYEQRLNQQKLTQRRS